VLGLSLLTNWLGYAFVAGTAFALSPPELPASWALGSVGLRALSGALVAIVFGYVGLCFAARRREWTIRGHRVVLPSGAVALWQLGVSVANWALIAGVVYVLMQQHVAYASVLCVLLIAAIAGVITHVPAGLGVIEAVFIALLSGQVPQAELIAALLAYRAIYYLAPLGIAVALLFALEVRGSRGSRGACESAADTDRHTGRRSIANSSYTR
jgi:uncharacterized membrane protein YbhN (UPF0104 family)